MPHSSAEDYSLLILHQDPELLDQLTRTFEAQGYQVSVGATALAAIGHLERRREFDAIVAAWDPAGRLGPEVYWWVLRHRYQLRGQVVFLADGDEPPEGFDELVEGRCLVIPSDDRDELVRVVGATARRSRSLAETELTAVELEWLEEERPSMLLVDDEPLQLSLMARMMSEAGFTVAEADSGEDALAWLRHEDFDVVVSDWYMARGSGATILEWVRDNRPDMLDRLVFISAGIGEAVAEMAPGCLLIPKGQDSSTLIGQLEIVARKARRH